MKAFASIVAPALKSHGRPKIACWACQFNQALVWRSRRRPGQQAFFSQTRPSSLASRSFFTSHRRRRKPKGSPLEAVIVIGGLLIYSLYPADEFDRLKARAAARRASRRQDGDDQAEADHKTARFDNTNRNESNTNNTDFEWGKISD